MVERLVRRGAVEFAGFADTLHPAWGESVRLTYECAWLLDACAPTLAPAAAEACLRLRVQPPVNGTANPGLNAGARPGANLRIPTRGLVARTIYETAEAMPMSFRDSFGLDVAAISARHRT